LSCPDAPCMEYLHYLPTFALKITQLRW
jgi:hypothetical protein